MQEDDGNKHPSTTITTSTSTSYVTAIVATIFLISFSTITATADDVAIMTKISQSFNPPPPNWFGNNPCSWQGVNCDTSKRIISITLVSKSISGTLPSEITQLSSLQTLSLQNNLLTGPIPSLANMSQLQEISLDRNLFSKISSDFLVGLPSLRSFSISDNPLQSWNIPYELHESTSLQQFRASNANLVGSIPDIFGSLDNLKDLRLSYNNLTGYLPDSFAGSSIHNLWINNQKQGLFGVLDVLGKMPNLVQVWVQDNDFVGPIPNLSNCVSLFDLQLRDNDLTGVVPPSITNLPKLVNISLQNNKLQGPTPVFRQGVQVTLGSSNSFCKNTPGPCDPQVTALLNIVADFGYPNDLVDSWKGNDACNNWPHVTCDPNGKVTLINFAKQGYSGFISPSFANLTSLTSIILSNNHFVGRIPEVLSNLDKLKKFDISNNNLTGKLPSFGINVEVISIGNPFLGTNVNTSTSLESPPGMYNYSPVGAKDGSSYSKSHLTSYETTGIVIGVLLLLIAAGFLLYPRIKKWLFGRVYGSGPSPFNKGDKGHNVEDFKMSPMIPYFGRSPMRESSLFSTEYNTYGNVFPIELIREVTNNFSAENILGQGGFGIVYKGVLQDGTQIAVKRMETNIQGTKGKNEFEAEILVLSKVRHRNLVALLGYCINGNERIMVYECMPQGTLGQHLFEYKKMGKSPLTWKQRLVIALDVARGVEYLHGLAQQSFIHRDLKPSNVLLGDDMRAKVSDFGLVKSVSEQGKYSMETRLAGTFGYLAPEYAITGRVTTKVDVFAYGVILMELITGRKSLDENLPEDQVQLSTWFRRVLTNKESIRKAMDPNLEGNEEEIFKSICKVAELAGHCTTREPLQRPDMSHTVNVLSPLVQLWRPSEIDGGNDWVGNDMDMSLPHALEKWRVGETMSGYSHEL